MAGCIFIGYDRVKDVANRKGLTRRNMATLLGISDDEFVQRFSWENLYGEEAAPGLGAGRTAGELRPSL
jgi:hypothetical protein